TLGTLTELSTGPIVTLFFAMLADAADYSEWCYHRRATGLCYSAGTVAMKFGAGVGGALTGLLLAAFGYVAASGVTDARQSATEPHAQAQPRILGDLVDVSEEFEQPDQVHFVAGRVTQFDPATGGGVLRWDRYMRQPSYSFNKMDMVLARAGSNEFPGTEYDRD